MRPMGGGRWDANAADIRRALALYRTADAILIALLAVIDCDVHRASLSSAIEIEMGRQMRRQRIERALDQIVVGDIRRLPAAKRTSQAARCRSSANRPWI